MHVFAGQLAFKSFTVVSRRLSAQYQRRPPSMEVLALVWKRDSDLLNWVCGMRIPLPTFLSLFVSMDQPYPTLMQVLSLPFHLGLLHFGQEWIPCRVVDLDLLAFDPRYVVDAVDRELFLIVFVQSYLISCRSIIGCSVKPHLSSSFHSREPTIMSPGFRRSIANSFSSILTPKVCWRNLSYPMQCSPASWAQGIGYPPV